MIGERIREARQSQGRSLADVAAKLKISVATLSRIENEKQSVDLGLFLSLARVLQVPPQEFLMDSEDEGNGKAIDPLARKIASLAIKERTTLWRELTEDRRSRRAQTRGQTHDIGQQVEELVAQLEFLREELESVRKRVKSRK